LQNLSGGTRFKCYPGPFSSVSYTSDIYNHSLFISLSSVAIGVNSVPLAPTTIYHHWLRLRAFAEIYLYIVPICQRTNQ